MFKQTDDRVFTASPYEVTSDIETKYAFFFFYMTCKHSLAHKVIAMSVTFVTGFCVASI